MARGFGNEPLDDIVAVGKTGPESVRLWMRTRAPGRYRVWWQPEGAAGEAGAERTVEMPPDEKSDHTLGFMLPGEGAALEPLQRYRYRITSQEDGRLVGEGRFETAPREAADTPACFSFAAMSCNQPFGESGAVRADARQMLAAAQRCLERHDVKFIFMMGDQMYADLPENLSLFDPAYFATVAPPGRRRVQDCTTDEVRRLYQQRYRHFWNLSGLKQLFACYPCYTILDDHDIVDNWGSDPAHQTLEWKALGAGARWAYYDYQGRHMLPDTTDLPASFHYAMRYGHTAAFVMDLRSERRADAYGRLYSDAQERDLRAFLAEHRGRKVLLFVLSVPPVHLPRLLARVASRLSPSGEDFSDRWSSLAHIRDRDRFLEIIRIHQKENPQQRVVLLSGDIHIGCVHELRWEEGGGGLHQFISSGLTNRASRAIRVGSKWLIRFNRTLATRDGEVKAAVRLLRGVDGKNRNPYGMLNLGIVQVQAAAPEAPAKLRFLLYGRHGDEPVCVYTSPWV